MTRGLEKFVLAALRWGLGFIFFWAFLDKTFGLGFPTPAAHAWLAGYSPTAGYLVHTSGVFAGAFHNMAQSQLVAWLFMLGLFGVGLALLLGIAMNIAAVAGSVMLLLIWLSELPLTANPFLDQHLIYILLLILLSTTSAGEYAGFGKQWQGLPLIQHNPWLK